MKCKGPSASMASLMLGSAMSMVYSVATYSTSNLHGKETLANANATSCIGDIEQLSLEHGAQCKITAAVKGQPCNWQRHVSCGLQDVASALASTPLLCKSMRTERPLTGSQITSTALCILQDVALALALASSPLPCRLAVEHVSAEYRLNVICGHD